MANTYEEAVFSGFRDYARQSRTGNSAISGPAPWPEPDLAVIEQHRDATPPLPLEPFGRPWAPWIESAAEAEGAPPDFVVAGLLPAVGAILSTKRRATLWPGWSEPPVIWTACVGRPSSNKSPALDAAAELLRQVEVELNEDFALRRREYKTAKLEAELRHDDWEAAARTAVKSGHAPPLMPAAAEEPDPPQPHRLLVNDATPEKLVRLSAANERGLVLFRDELAGWIGGMDKYGGNGSDRALWLEAFGGRPYRLDRVKDGDKPIVTPSLAVGIMGGIQPDRLASMILAGDDDGLAARILYVWPEAAPPRRPDRFPDTIVALARMRRLAQLGEREEAMPFAPAAADQIQGWREDVARLEKDAHGLFLSWLGKLPGAAVRLALVLEFLHWTGQGGSRHEPDKIGEEATEGALALLEAYFLPMARRVFGDAAWPEVERDAAALARWIKSQHPLPERVNARDLRRKAALATRDPPRFDRALAELAEAGWLRPLPDRAGDTPGRQRKDWQVSPKLGAAA